MSRYTKKVDIFSESFQFAVGKNFKKKTGFGGVLSIMLIIIFIIYFVYLFYRYFTNSFIPIINSKKMNEVDKIEFPIKNDFFYFEIMIGEITLGEYEKQTGKKYINFVLYYEEFTNDGNELIKEIPTKNCGDQDLFSNYRCIDTENIDQELSIMADNINLIQSNLALQVQRCLNLPECATVDEIDDLILNPLNYFQVYMKIEQYNTTSQKLEASYKLDYHFFDIDLVQQTTYNLKKSITEIKSGLFVQSSEIIDNLTGYVQDTRYYTSRKLDYRQGIIGYGEFYVELSQDITYTVIQMPMITYILTQFLSVVNSLLAIGLITRYLGQSIILKEVASLILKNYYKNTAIELMKKDQEKQNDDNNEQSVNKIDQIINSVDKFNYDQNIESHLNKGFLNKVKFIFNNQVSRVDSNKESIIYEHILKEARHQIDIYEIIKDFLKMKKAFKMSLSPQQYAALQYCGSKINFQNNSQNNSIQKSIIENNKNQFLKDLEQNIKQKEVQASKSQIVPLNTEIMKTKTFCQASTIAKIEQASKAQINVDDIVDTTRFQYRGKQSINIFENKQNNQSNDRSSFNSLKQYNQTPLQEQLNIQKSENSVPVNSFNKIQNPKQEQIQFENHIYKQDQIKNDSEICKQNLQKFFNKFQCNQNISQLDQRLYGTLYKQKQN